MVRGGQPRSTFRGLGCQGLRWGAGRVQGHRNSSGNEGVDKRRRGRARGSVPRGGGWGGRCVQCPDPGELGSAVSLRFQLLWVKRGDFFIKTLLPFSSSSL